MTLDEIRLSRLSRQHLLAPENTQTVVQDLCGVQAQFLSHALHSLSIRCETVQKDYLIKSWTNRGTLHLLSPADLPLFFREGRRPLLRPVDTLVSDAWVSSQRKDTFAHLLLEAIAAGTDKREALKQLCRSAGMTAPEEKSLFDPWGGIIRALCESGQICHKVQKEKAYQLCPPFTPMSKEEAQLELLRRYFTHFGPATVKDAAYFFGTTQTQIRALLPRLTLSETALSGKPFFYLGETPKTGSAPACLFLAEFDQLMLGYEKKESLFFPQEALREIFNLAGIVRPVILVNGQAVGCWRLQRQTLSIHLFAPADPAVITAAARRHWQSDLKISYM